MQCFGCKEAVCKTCAQFLDEDTFSFSESIPNGLEEGAYCVQCFETKVRPEIVAYDQMVSSAKDIQVFMKNQSKEYRLLKRAEKPVQVVDCEDREETLLRLAFLALEAGFDTLVDVDIFPKKVRAGTYQKSMWQGVGIPARFDAKRIGK